MPSFNRVTLMGNLTRDPQVKQLPTTTVAEFGLAMSRRFKAGDGEDRDEVCFVDCAAFGRQAETISQYCTKGRPLFVEGRLKYDTWDDRAGNKRSKVSVVVENFQFISPRGEDGGQGSGNSAARNGHAAQARNGNADSPVAAGSSDHGHSAPEHARNTPEQSRGNTDAEHAAPPAKAGGGRRSARGAAVAEKAKFNQADIPF